MEGGGLTWHDGVNSPVGPSVSLRRVPVEAVTQFSSQPPTPGANSELRTSLSTHGSPWDEL